MHHPGLGKTDFAAVLVQEMEAVARIVHDRRTDEFTMLDVFDDFSLHCKLLSGVEKEVGEVGGRFDFPFCRRTCYVGL